MELQILTSKKGTKVIKSTILHRALKLKDTHYANNVKHWISDIYQFKNEIRKPAGMVDYALSKQSTDSILKEYYLSIEFARLIALSSRSRAKEAVANKLAKIECDSSRSIQLSASEMIELLEQTKAMARVSCQLKAEERHANMYSKHKGSMKYWNLYRSKTIDLNKEELIKSLEIANISYPKRASLRELIMRRDPDQLIRIGLIDHYISLGYSVIHAQEIGTIGYHLAKQMSLEIVDNRAGEQLFSRPVDADVLAKLSGAAA